MRRCGGRLLPATLAVLAALLLAGTAGAANYIANGSFEGSTSGWNGWQASLSIVTPGYDGTRSVRVARTTGAYYSIVTAGKPVASTMQGVVYTATAWVRSVKPGKSVCIKVREWSGATQIASAERCLVTTSAWQKLTVGYAARGTARQLDMYLHQPSSAVAGDSFDADLISLTDPDTTPPDTTITSGPSGSTTATDASFAFASSESGSTFQCRLDAAAWAACSSPKSYSALAVGSHTFEVRATDAAGNVDASPASRSWTVVGPVAAETTITAGPSGVDAAGRPTFQFSSSDPAATFECSLDSRPWSACVSPYSIGVASGSHTFDVRAVNGAGADPTPARRTWWADPLLPNGTFELSTTGWDGYQVAGWKGYQSTLSTGTGRSGSSGVVAYASGTSYSAYSQPRPVNVTVAGRIYTVDGWIRSSVAGRTFCLRARELSGNTLVGSAQRCTASSTTWVRVPFSYTAVGGNELEIDVYQTVAPVAGDSFEVDDVTVDDGRSRAPTPPAGADPTLTVAADIAACGAAGDEETARLLDGIPGQIQTVGDNAYPNGTAGQFAGCFGSSWGRHKDRLNPALGDHELDTDPQANPYFDYFGAAAGPRGKGYYSYDIGAWHVIVLNANCAMVGGCDAGSPEELWLRADLAASSANCTVAVVPAPLFSSGTVHGSKAAMRPFWQALYEGGAELVLSGDDHIYERFVPQTPAGVRDDSMGVRQFVVGTGGYSHYGIGTPLANSEARNNDTFGVLSLTLRAGAYDWRFVAQDGRTFADSGSGSCHASPRDTTPPTVALTAPADGASVSGTTTVSADAADNVSIARVDFLVNGSPVGSSTAAPYSASWNTTSTANGQATVVAKAFDAAGNSSTSTRTVMVNNAPAPGPSTSIDSGPSGTTSATDATFTFSSTTSGATFQCALDGAAWSACTSPKAYTGLAAGSHTFTARAVNSSGVVDPAPPSRTWTIQSAPPPPPANVIANGTFEGSLDGWYGYKAALSLVGNAHSGAQAAHAVLNAPGTSFSMITAPPAVSNTTTGTAYSATAWVRSDVAGKSVCLRIRENAPGGVVAGSVLRCLTATAAWQQFPVLVYNAVGSGNTIEVYVYLDAAVAGDSFDLDDVSLVQG